MSDMHNKQYDIPNDLNAVQAELNRAQYVQSVYELAINSAGIGIFYYDVDRYGAHRFEANDIYAELLGFTPDDDGLYALADFEACVMEVEDNIADQISVHESLHQLLEGEVDGTHEDLLKLRNLKTNVIKYFISSSHIDDRYEDGRPKRLGGSIIDITERVMREKNQMKFAFTDELTRLANNRKLIHDMHHRKDGIGLLFDLDNFKRVNDTYGHQVGDVILRMYAKSLKYAASQYDNVYPYRLYGDEFFVFCEDQDLSFGSTYEGIVRSHMKELLPELKQDIHIDASMGLSLYQEGMDIDEFIKEADYSMYTIKIAKKQRNKRMKP